MEGFDFPFLNDTPIYPRTKWAPSVFQEGNAVLSPLPERRSCAETALILLPGCMLKPEQYASFCRSIQQQTEESALWIHVPKQVHGFSNPLMVGRCVRSALQELKQEGFSGTSAFIGGHSLGAAFLPSVLNDIDKDQVDGFVHLGCVVPRVLSVRNTLDDSSITTSIPRLTVCGDLDGLVRTSRVAEDYYRNVESIGNTEKDKLHHAVVLVHGMNHFGIVEGRPTFMHKWRDLEAEISKDEAIHRVATTVAQFMACHREGDQKATRELLEKIETTYRYIEPLIEAMQLEGSYHLESPCHLCDMEESDKPCRQGSLWAARVQDGIRHAYSTERVPLGGSLEELRGTTCDEFHHTWWVNPFADPPFYHPSIDNKDREILTMKTVSEPVYEKPDFFLFDAGFFSNAALEIRSKMNSPQAILRAQGLDSKYEPNCESCSMANHQTIQWAVKNAPALVLQRYEERGVKLVAGPDKYHRTGEPQVRPFRVLYTTSLTPSVRTGFSWIWSYLEFRRVDTRTGEFHRTMLP